MSQDASGDGRRRSALPLGRRTALVGVVAAMLVLAGCGTVLSSDDGEVPRFEGGGEFAFEEVSESVGFEYEVTDKQMYGNMRVGTYVTDYDNDGWPDLLAIGNEEPVLFHNTGGAFERSGVLPPVDITVKGALFFDYDNDGDDDLLLTPFEGKAVFLENTGGDFERQSVGLGVNMTIGHAASAADFDGDGCLDVFVGQNGDWRKHPPQRAKLPPVREGEMRDIGSIDEEDDQEYMPKVGADNGLQNLFFEGDCESFEQAETGVTGNGIVGQRWSTAVSFLDFTGDGLPDVHVANDYNYDVLYVNEGDGTWRTTKIDGTNRHGMASEVVDVNYDGRPDVFVTNVRFDEPVWRQLKIPNSDNSGNSLLLNEGDGEFEPAEDDYGVADGGWGWAAAFVDFDNDRDPDLFQATDYYQTQADLDTVVKTRPRFWERTNGSYQRLDSEELGFEITRGRGLSHLDYDLDGDQDLVISNADGEYKFYENTVDEGNSLQVTVDSGYGATMDSNVSVTAGDVTRYQRLNAKGDLLSQDTRVLHFGLGANETADLRIETPDGEVFAFEDVEANQRLVLRPDGSLETLAETGDDS